MRGYLRDFEIIVKGKFHDLRPDCGLNGTATFQFPDETSADEYVSKIIEYGRQFKRFSNLEIASCYNGSIGEKINLEEGITTFYSDLSIPNMVGTIPSYT